LRCRNALGQVGTGRLRRLLFGHANSPRWASRALLRMEYMGLVAAAVSIQA
jgi:hypothetical protein